MKFSPFSPAMSTEWWMTYRTYSENAWASPPADPTGDGSTSPWGLTRSAAAKWKSEKLSTDFSTYYWGRPQAIAGAEDGDAPVYWYTLASSGSASPGGWSAGYFNVEIAGVAYLVSGLTAGASHADTEVNVNAQLAALGVPATIEYTGGDWVLRSTSRIHRVYSGGGSGAYWGGASYMNFAGNDGGEAGEDWAYHFYCYHDNEWTNPPADPSGDGDADGWYNTGLTAGSKWKSHKLATSISAGDWEGKMPI